MVTVRPSTITRKMRFRNRLATAATILIGCCVSPIPAFQTAIPLHRQRINVCVRRPTRQWTVTDPDILLREKIPRLSIDMAALEKAYSSSSDFEEISFLKRDQDAVETASLPKQQRTKKIAPRKDGRSSTMPGFATRNSGRQQAFRDGIVLAEQRSGKKFVDTPEMKKKRRKQSNEAMYKTTAAVPDSLVRFANEIHLVSDGHAK